MARSTGTIVLAFRIFLFIILGALFVYESLRMEVASAKTLFIGIAVADWLYAAFLGHTLMRRLAPSGDKE